MNDRYSPGIPLYIFLISDICCRHGLKQGLIHGNLVADGWAGAVMRKPIAIQFFFRTDGPTDTARCRVACPRLKRLNANCSLSLPPIIDLLVLLAHPPPSFVPLSSMGFLRKVYGILSAQLMMTTLIAALFMTSESIKGFVQGSPNVLFSAMILSFVMMIALFVKRRDAPANFILLGLFVSP